jgi:hypothetical protein
LPFIRQAVVLASVLLTLVLPALAAAQEPPIDIGTPLTVENIPFHKFGVHGNTRITYDGNSLNVVMKSSKDNTANTLISKLRFKTVLREHALQDDAEWEVVNPSLVVPTSFNPAVPRLWFRYSAHWPLEPETNYDLKVVLTFTAVDGRIRSVRISRPFGLG